MWPTWVRSLCFFLMDLMLSYQEEEEQEEEDDDEDDDDTDDLDELDTDQLLEAELEEDDNNENAGEDGDNDFSPSDEELANLLEEGEDGEDEDSDADEEVELILGDSKSRADPEAESWHPGEGPFPILSQQASPTRVLCPSVGSPLWPLEKKQFHISDPPLSHQTVLLKGCYLIFKIEVCKLFL